METLILFIILKFDLVLFERLHYKLVAMMAYAAVTLLNLYHLPSAAYGKGSINNL